MESRKDMETNGPHPEDKSLEAYMAWIVGRRLAHGGTEPVFTSVEWAAAWKEYWQEGANC